MLVKLVHKLFPRTYTAIFNKGYDTGVTAAEQGTTSY